MTFWHGTTIENARKIQEEGLRPQPEKKYKIYSDWRGSLEDIEKDENVMSAVYLSSIEEKAIGYAKFRTAYEKANAGELISVPELSAWTKLAPRGQISSPAVIRFELPEQVVSLLSDDNQDWNGGYKYSGAISPEFVKEVIAL